MASLNPEQCTYSIADATALVTRCEREVGHDGVHTAVKATAFSLDQEVRSRSPLDGPPQLTAPPLVSSTTAESIEARALARYRSSVLALADARRLKRAAEEECRAARTAWCESIGVYDDEEDLPF